MRRVARAAAVLLVASGCAPAFVCPTKGGPEWRELRTEHFVLRTDRPAEGARALALELEQIRDAVAHSLFQSPPRPRGLVQVVVLRSWEEFDLFAEPGVGGLFTSSVWGEPTIILPGMLGKLQRAVVAHELAHVLGAADLGRRPPWFQEGTASYVETIGFYGPDANVALGEVPRLRGFAAVNGIGDLRRLLAERDSLQGEDYGLAWALVHFLLNERPDGFMALEDRFAAGEDPHAAWRAVFPEWDPAAGGIERLGEALKAYFSMNAKVYVYRHRRLASIPSPAERVLAPAEVHDVRLALRWPNRGAPLKPGRRLEEAREAVAEDVGSPTAVALLGAEGPAIRGALAERATRARPDDARTWALLAMTLPDSDVGGRDAALRRAVTVDPENRFALVALAAHLLETKRAKEALPWARKAVELAPWSAGALDTAAGVLEALGECRNALDLAQRAIANVGEHASDDVRGPVVARRDRLARACGDPPDASR